MQAAGSGTAVLGGDAPLGGGVARGVVRTMGAVEGGGGGGGSGLTTAAELAHLVRAEGVGALFAGLGPRVLKVAPSCAITICSYEAGKRFFERGRAEGGAS